MHFMLVLITSLGLFGSTLAQFPPTPQDVTTLKSKFNSDITISYKEPGICETTPGVKSYAGYVHLPPGTLSDVGGYNNYSINTFFWFFESRKDPANAPLSMWFNGGPGASSLLGALQENGPCTINDDSNSTSLNPWSWNNEVNMLYIDQPNQVGFSWDILTNGTLNLTSYAYELQDFSNGVPEQNNSFLVGTFPSQNPGNTANDTQNAARALWHFAQTWFQEFPDYKPNNDAISIFTESYGGHYGPVFSTFFEEQNAAIANGSFKETGDAYVIHLDTLGIINGCIDYLSQELSFPTIAYNNTYGIQAIDKATYDAALAHWNEPETGCLARILQCQVAEAQGDPNNYGNNNSVSDACSEAVYTCNRYVDGPYAESSRNYYDFAAFDPDPFPPNYFLGYLSQAYVQAALGVPVNFTSEATSPYNAFTSTGDFARSTVKGGYLQDLAFILDSGVKLALIYGDRDYICNWLGGENVSLNVPYSQNEKFQGAGYANISTNASYIGGQVRQYGNFSFSRVFQSGHEVPAYQPETAYQIFTRAIFGTDIATGTKSTNNDPEYATEGSSTTFQVKNQDPGSPSPQCYILDLADTCTADQMKSVWDGSGLIHDYILIDQKQTNLFPGIGNNEPVPTTTTTSATSTGAAKPGTKTGGVGSLEMELGELILAVSLVVVLGL